MSLDFTQVTYDGDIEDFSDEQLRTLAREFEQAQTENKTEFEQAAETLNTQFTEFNQAREELIEEITDAPAFSKIPLSEEELGEQDFSSLQEWKEFVSDGEGDEDGPSDFGKKSPEAGGNGGDFDTEINDRLSEISGVNAE